MSARDVIADTPWMGQMRIGLNTADRILAALHDIPAPDRLTLARALLPDGWVVAKVPDRATPETVPWRYGDEWVGVQDGASEESLDLICNGHADGWNACRAAFIASGEEGA